LQGRFEASELLQDFPIVVIDAALEPVLEVDDLSFYPLENGIRDPLTVSDVVTDLEVYG
jgi:hypothetical protein